MFAVPGWSVSADKLKTEKAIKPDVAPSNKARKRKRATVPDNVTASNVADLWESVVEGKKPAPSKDAQPGKKQKKSDEGVIQQRQDEGVADEQSRVAEESLTDQTEPKKSKKEKKKKKKQGVEAEDSQIDQDGAAAVSNLKSKAPKPKAAPAPPKLTPLQASMREKLVSARFRHLNETLYTKPSDEAYQLFQDSPEMFNEYHEGFRRQVKVWPENPVDSFLQDIRTRGKIRTPSRGPAPLLETPLPRTVGTCTIADLGCGDARLAESLRKEAGKMRIDMRSFDLQSPSALVTKADIANLPLADGSVNVAIFCLALMGTNWVDFVEEAYRILHWKGELWIAEIKSRFAPLRPKNARVTHSVGNRKKAGKPGRPAADDGANDQDLAVEVDGLEDRRRETDVSAFIEVLKKRGFVLQGERNTAVDLSNKMFVKMHFIKGASPVKGKGAAAAPEPTHRSRKVFATKLDEVEDQEGDVNEASVLKPCVYKIR
ncbi:hypothetical protein S40285_00976 [Stachybotrys chlorohalonatus IBT 40285]|uniref:Ribosomal RNA-processing protein 8 n=1 Tax=Stachybotrys chlorohalonatus (strain IBT 40285) TaxID=1283841 RepID=A0A084QUS7_STAC4|nr:hypothetical protein S40285_00976 [Stachybotrys chlorohalonata IBT 40285]